MNKVNNEQQHGDDRVGGWGREFLMHELLLNIGVVVKSEILKPTEKMFTPVPLLISVTLAHLKILISVCSIYLHFICTLQFSQKIERDF